MPDFMPVYAYATAMKRAFSAAGLEVPDILGGTPGWHETAPLR